MAVFLLISGLLFSAVSPVSACGTVGGWIYTYEQGQRHKALFHMLDCASSYVAPEDDIALLPVIADALKRRSKIAKLADQVFRMYNCLHGARDQKGYLDVVKGISRIGGPVDLKKYRGWLVVTAKGGANLRSKPSLEGQRLTAVLNGMQVKSMGKSGEWVKVTPVGPGAVDPRYERVVGYIHHTLLTPY